MRRPGIKPGSRPWQGRILSLYYRRKRVSIPRLELGTSRVLGERHSQLDHTDILWLEYLGFDPSTSTLLRSHASDCANTPGASGFRSQYLVLAKHARFRLRQCPDVSLGAYRMHRPRAGFVIHKKKNSKSKNKLRHGESNPGHLRDRQRCYQLHHAGRNWGQPPARIELATLRLLSACSAN